MKRIFSLILAAMLLLGMVSAASAATGTPSMPETFKASKGISYALLTVPAGTEMPALSIGNSNPKVAVLSKDGTLKALKLGKATVTAVTTRLGEEGTEYKCKVTVIPNTFTRKKPLRGEGTGVFTSTKKLYYKNGKLYIELFILNRSGKKIKRAENLTLELFDGGQPVYSKTIPLWKRKSALPNKKYAVLKLSIPVSELPQDPLDLGLKQVQAVLSGMDVSGQPFVGVKALRAMEDKGAVLG